MWDAAPTAAAAAGDAAKAADEDRDDGEEEAFFFFRANFDFVDDLYRANRASRKTDCCSQKDRGRSGHASR